MPPSPTMATAASNSERCLKRHVFSSILFVRELILKSKTRIEEMGRCRADNRPLRAVFAARIPPMFARSGPRGRQENLAVSSPNWPLRPHTDRPIDLHRGMMAATQDNVPANQTDD